ncbi:MAG: PhoH family protein [Elusimicrobia bacterium]|nr:PhoH family protein [Elusimicrobiota bacterium]
MVTKRLFLGDREEALHLCGEHDTNLKTLEKRLGVQIFARSSTLAIRGNVRKVDEALSYLQDMREKIHQDKLEMEKQKVRTGEHKIETEHTLFPRPEGSMEEPLYLAANGKKIYPQSVQQKKYVEAIEKFDLVMAVGPAGTGKTFLAVASSLKELLSGRVRKIVLTRPVVEAGEKLGFLPGDFYDKVDPYLKPLYDAFHLLLGQERFRIYREDETIEIVPLAYMRGRTLENSFVILDEAQNTTPEQMKMFLTRMGFRSKMVVTGDITQIDLDFKTRSGFVHSLKILKNIPEIHVVQFSEQDIVRHPLVRKILRAYSSSEEGPSSPS